MTVCLFSCTLRFFWKWSFLKGKHLLPKGLIFPRIFPLKVDPFSERDKNDLDKFTSPESLSIHLTFSLPNFRRIRRFFICFLLNKLLFVKKFICKVERLNIKQRRSRWDGLLWAVSSGSMLFAKAYYYRLWQWKRLSNLAPISPSSATKASVSRK